MTESSEQRLIAFLEEEIVTGPAPPIDADTPLVSTGLVDSFALVQVLAALERIARVRIPPGRVSPQDLETVRAMLELAARFGASG